MKYILSTAVLAATLWHSSAEASDYPIVLVHGFQPAQLASRPNQTAVEQDGANYWQDFWLPKATARIDWPSHERITGRIISDYAWPVLRQLSQQGTCHSGCIFVTHSTGDLVTRYILDNQALWLQNAGLQPLNIVATLDFAGAGGGSELADLAINVANGGSWIDATLRFAISLWLGETPSPGNLGVLNDLRVNSARQLAAFPDERIPRIRMVAASNDYFGTTGLFLPGTDDGVVASHSSCGATSVAAFHSCSNQVGFNGKVAAQSQAVTSFMPYHYPMLMSDNYSHNGILTDRQRGQVTLANASVNFTDQTDYGFDSDDISSGWWIFSSTYRVVRGSDQFSLSELVYQELLD
ncbi:MAG: hypothetical protein JJU30_10200 [Alkalimonas sp.]|nr:hypothetical protein [Alkalimonas sp.]